MLKHTVRRLLDRYGYSLSNLKLIPSEFLIEDNLLKITFDLVVARQILKSSDFFFIQVGAFDGIECDPLRDFILKHGWRGVLLEPQKKAFELLRYNYSDQPQLILKNAAIADQRSTRTLYTVGSDQLPAWCRSLASFDRNVILKHKELVPGIEDLIETEEVECITFANLIDEFRIKNIDLLQMDAEGYDAELIGMFPFDRVRPHIVRFERKHLSRDELSRALAILVRNNYRFANDGAEDLIAYCEQEISRSAHA